MFLKLTGIILALLVALVILVNATLSTNKKFSPIVELRKFHFRFFKVIFSFFIFLFLNSKTFLTYCESDKYFNNNIYIAFGVFIIIVGSFVLVQNFSNLNEMPVSSIRDDSSSPLSLNLQQTSEKKFSVFKPNPDLEWIRTIDWTYNENIPLDILRANYIPLTFESGAWNRLFSCSLAGRRAFTFKVLCYLSYIWMKVCFPGYFIYYTLPFLE